MKKGKIIVIEGTDGSGKETQTKKILSRFKEEYFPFQSIDFPRYNTPTGRIVGQSYLGKNRESWSGDSGWFGEADDLDPKIASLYYAADRRAAIPKIQRIINLGSNLILDRYFYSNMAHQGGKIKNIKEREKMFEWLEKLELGLLELPKEDTTIFLHMPTDISIKLKKETKEMLDGHERNVSHLRRAEETYLQLAKRYDWTTISCSSDGINPRSIEDIHQNVYEHVKKILD